MVRLTLLVTTLLAGLQTAEAVAYGCWSGKSNKFREDCVVALTSLVTKLTVKQASMFVSVPARLVENSYGRCRATLKTRHGNSVLITQLLSSYDQLASRCQNGFFYYDDGWLNAELQGQSGFKVKKRRDFGNIEDANKAEVRWETEETVEQIPLPPATTEEPKSDENTKRADETSDAFTSVNKRQHTKDILRRARPTGTFILTSNVNGRVYTLYRGTGFIAGGLSATSYLIPQMWPVRLIQMLERVRNSGGNDIIRDGIALATGSTVNAIAIAVQLGKHPNWQTLITTVGGQGGVIGEMMASALYNLQKHGYTGAVYHIYDSFQDVIVTFIMNGVTGQVSALPPS